HTAYNYDNPDFNMTKEKVVKPSGFGAVFKHFGGQSSIDGPTYSTKLFSEQVASEENLLLGSVKRIDFTPGYSITTNKNVHYGIISTELDVIEPSVLHFKDKNFLDSQKNYTASFKCMSPVTVKYRSSFPYINPQIPGIQIAYVVGDKETYMDKQGRVQVKFLWDRHFSQNQEQLYIRMMQPSASKEAGTHYKVYPGDEVLVSFLEGGVEEPVIIGALYNGKHEQSIPEEGAGDSHGFKTLGGHHVAYIDKKGSEEISISSAKKMSLKSVENCEITQKNLDIKTTELVKIEQKQLEVNTTDSLAIKVGITDVKIDKQGSIELSVGSFKMKIDGMAGIIAISGASATSISGTLNVDTVVAKSVIRGGTAL
ncbi:MAG: phage baseplate assembly protein V, partial [Bdellovibrionota bacterium]